MKTIFILSVVLAVIAVAGCNRSIAETRPHQHTPAATYKEGHGLKLSARGAQFVSLEIADAGTRTIGSSANVTAIPSDALLRTVRGDFVYVANGEWFLRTPIKLGASDGGWLEVAEGLYEGDRIVVRGTRALWLAEAQAVNGGVACIDGH